MQRCRALLRLSDALTTGCRAWHAAALFECASGSRVMFGCFGDTGGFACGAGTLGILVTQSRTLLRCRPMIKRAVLVLVLMMLIGGLSCSGGHNGDWGLRAQASADEEEALRRLMKSIEAAKEARNTPGLSAGQRKELDEAIAGAERAAKVLVRQRTKGRARIKTMQTLALAATLIAATM